jgi:hypothetical protein
MFYDTMRHSVYPLSLTLYSLSHTRMLFTLLLLPIVMCTVKQMAALQDIIAANAQFEAEVCAVLNSSSSSNGSVTTATAGTAVATIIALQSSLAQAQQQLQQQQQQQQLPVTPASRPRSTSDSTSAELTRQWQGLASHYHDAILQLATALHVHVDTTSSSSSSANSSSSSASMLAAAQQAARAVDYGELVAAAGEAVWAQRSLAAVASTLQCAVTDVHAAVQALVTTASTASAATAAAAAGSSVGHRSGAQQQQQQQQQDAAGWDWDDGDSNDVAGDVATAVDTDFMGTTASSTTATTTATAAAAAVAAADAQLQQFVRDVSLQLHCTATSAAVGTAVTSLSDVLAALDVELQGGLGGGAGIPGAAEEGQFCRLQLVYQFR